MAFPNGGLITETNRQYYAGSQGFQVQDLAQTKFTFDFNTDLYLGSWDQNEADYTLNNFKLYKSADGIDYDEYLTPYTLLNNTITFPTAIPIGHVIVVQLKSLEGGNYGNYDAYGEAVENNYGGYSYISLDDIINNFIVAYVGDGKLISNVKRTDVLFHAKRALQEFSYDTLKSIKSQELTVPPSLSLILPQDYVNYVKMSRIDHHGIKHIIYPTSLTIDPYETPLQDNIGQPIQSSFDDNIQGTSLTEERYKENNNNLLFNEDFNDRSENGYINRGNYYGRQYGMDPQYANYNGNFFINDRQGKISFSSNLVHSLLVLEYVSDGLAYELDSRVPKMAEEAMYAYILHAIVSTRANQPEYLVQRLKQEKNAKLRNTKIRLSNIKLEEISQVFRGQSKWIKH